MQRKGNGSRSLSRSLKSKCRKHCCSRMPRGKKGSKLKTVPGELEGFRARSLSDRSDHLLLWRKAMWGGTPVAVICGV